MRASAKNLRAEGYGHPVRAWARCAHGRRACPGAWSRLFRIAARLTLPEKTLYNPKSLDPGRRVVGPFSLEGTHGTSMPTISQLVAQGRPGKGPARRALSHRARQPGHPGRQGSQAGALEVRREAAEIRPTHESLAMPRRREIPKREILPDPKFSSGDVAKFVNVLMTRGKKSVAERIVYGAFDTIKTKSGKDPLEGFGQAGQNARPMVGGEGRRGGG